MSQQEPSVDEIGARDRQRSRRNVGRDERETGHAPCARRAKSSERSTPIVRRARAVSCSELRRAARPTAEVDRHVGLRGDAARRNASLVGPNSLATSASRSPAKSESPYV